MPDFYESFKVRAGSNVQLMERMFIAERYRQYNITVDIEQLENRFQYLLSDNPACAGRFLCDDYKPNPHDDSNITRCKNEANEIKPSEIRYQNTTTASSLKTLVNSKLD